MITVLGQIADALGHIAQYDGVEYRTRHHVVPGVEYRRRQADVIPVDLEHGEEVGTVEYLERRRDGSLWMVAVSPLNRLLTVDDPIRLSPSITVGTEPGDVELRSVALTFDPASVGLRPVVLVGGDFRSADVQQRWHNHTPAVDMLRRAAAYSKTRGWHAPLTIEAGPDAVVQTTNGAWFDDAGRPVTEARDRRNARGELIEYRTYPGKVLTVR